MFLLVTTSGLLHLIAISMFVELKLSWKSAQAEWKTAARKDFVRQGTQAKTRDLFHHVARGLCKADRLSPWPWECGRQIRTRVWKSLKSVAYLDAPNWWKFNIPVLWFYGYWLHYSCIILYCFIESWKAPASCQNLFWVDKCHAQPSRTADGEERRSLLGSLYRDASSLSYCSGRRNQGAYRKWSKAAWWTAWSYPALAGATAKNLGD